MICSIHIHLPGFWSPFNKCNPQLASILLRLKAMVYPRKGRRTLLPALEHRNWQLYSPSFWRFYKQKRRPSSNVVWWFVFSVCKRDRKIKQRILGHHFLIRIGNLVQFFRFSRMVLIERISSSLPIQCWIGRVLGDCSGLMRWFNLIPYKDRQVESTVTSLTRTHLRHWGVLCDPTSNCFLEQPRYCTTLKVEIGL